MNDHQIEKLLEEVISVVKKAADISENYSHPAIESKSFGNFVTEADKAVEAFLFSELSALVPGSVCLGEEQGRNGEGEYLWVVDPIDGTANYIFGFSYTLSVALKRGEETLLGVVYWPREELLYHAVRGGRAYREDKDGEVTVLDVKKNYLTRGMLMCGVPYDRTKSRRIFDALHALFPHYTDIRRIGPASAGICRLAEGKIKAYVELDLKPWDIAAGQFILERAGGAFRQPEDFFIFAGSEEEADDIVGILTQAGLLEE